MKKKLIETIVALVYYLSNLCGYPIKTEKEIMENQVTDTLSEDQIGSVLESQLSTVVALNRKRRRYIASGLRRKCGHSTSCTEIPKHMHVADLIDICALAGIDPRSL